METSISDEIIIKVLIVLGVGSIFLGIIIGLRYFQSRCQQRTHERRRDLESICSYIFLYFLTDTDSETGIGMSQINTNHNELSQSQLEEIGRNMELLNDPKFIDILREYEIAPPKLPRYQTMHRHSTAISERQQQVIISDLNIPHSPPPPAPENEESDHESINNTGPTIIVPEENSIYSQVQPPPYSTNTTEELESIQPHP